MRWLLAEGGPAVRYRTSTELLEREPGAVQERLLGDLLRTPRVRWLLRQMEEFGPVERVDIGVLNRLHGMKPTCLENVVARLLELGLHAGVPAFDRRMERLRGYVDNRLVRRALSEPDNPTVEGGRAVFVAIVLASHFIRGGYRHDEVLEFVERRIAMLSRVARARNYDIHLGPPELEGLPKPWAGRPILRPEMDPTSGTTPLPLVHDFFSLAHLQTRPMSRTTLRSVNEIVSYATSDRYRSLPPGYGYLWSKANRRTCYSCGWNLDLPDVDSEDPFHRRKIVQRLELLSRLPAARDSRWFRQASRLMESFRTDDGTYLLPRPFLVEAKTGYYVGGEYMGLEDNRRRTKAIELESTFRMLLLRRLLDRGAVRRRADVGPVADP